MEHYLKSVSPTLEIIVYEWYCLQPSSSSSAATINNPLAQRTTTNSMWGFLIVYPLWRERVLKWSDLYSPTITFPCMWQMLTEINYKYTVLVIIAGYIHSLLIKQNFVLKCNDFSLSFSVPCDDPPCTTPTAQSVYMQRHLEISSPWCTGSNQQRWISWKLHSFSRPAFNLQVCNLSMSLTRSQGQRTEGGEGEYRRTSAVHLGLCKFSYKDQATKTMVVCRQSTSYIHHLAA